MQKLLATKQLELLLAWQKKASNKSSSKRKLTLGSAFFIPVYELYRFFISEYCWHIVNVNSMVFA